MTKEEIEQKILQLVSNDAKFTPFIIRQEFKPRLLKEVRSVLAHLMETGKIKLDDNHFLFIPKSDEKR